MSLGSIALLQAAGLVAYCSLVGWFMLNAGKWIPEKPGFPGPAVFLLLFIVSAVITSLIYLGYPFYLIWEKKQTAAAIRLLLMTTAWVAGTVILGLASLAL